MLKKWKILKNFQTAQIISIFKKGYGNFCGNYIGFNLLNNAYKLYIKTVNNILMWLFDVLLLEEQSGFRWGRFCINDIFTLKQIFKKRRKFNLEMHIIFVNSEKTFDRVRKIVVYNAEERNSHHFIQPCQFLHPSTNTFIDLQNTHTSS